MKIMMKMALVSSESILLLLIFILTSSTVSKASPNNRISNSNESLQDPHKYQGTSHYETESMKLPPLCSPLIDQTRIYCPGKQSDNDTIELIGFLTSFDVDQNAVGTFIAGAVPLAVESVNRNDKLLPGRTLCFVAGDTGIPDTSESMKLMSHYRDIGAVGFVGLEHSCVQEATLAAAYDIPLISYKCADVKVSNKTIYKTFARTLPPSSKVSRSLISILKHFNWNKLIVVSDNTTADYKQIEDAFVSDLKKLNKERRASARSSTSGDTEKISSGIHADGGAGSSNPDFQIMATYHIPEGFGSKDIPVLKKIVDDTKDKTRIYVVLADIWPVFEFAYALQEKGLTDTGKYVIISIDKDEVYDIDWFDAFCDDNKPNPYSYDRNGSSDACRPILMLTPNAVQNETFNGLVLDRTSEPPFSVPSNPLIHEEMIKRLSLYAALAYDAVQVMATALTRAYEKYPEGANGSMVINEIIDTTYQSIMGSTQVIDGNGDAGGNWTVVAFQYKKKGRKESTNFTQGHMMPVAHFRPLNCSEETCVCLPGLNFNENRNIDWINNAAPKDEPKCGFENEKCIRDTERMWKQIILIVCCCFLMSLALVFIIRHYRYEQKLASLLWKVNPRDIILPDLGSINSDSGRTRSEYTLQNLRSTINFQGIDWSRMASFRPTTNHCNYYCSSLDIEGGHLSSCIGFFKGNVVFVKRIHKKNIDLSREIRKELIHVREMRHENINPFIGATVETNNICILTLYCDRGNLEDILRNEDLDMDMMFIASLVSDLIKGMIYLHDSAIISHGNLKSSNCLVDSRWVLQISDFGLHEFRGNQEITSKEDELKRDRGLLWKAPEFLRVDYPTGRGSQKGDVYSFAIVLYEIIGRHGPWGKDAPAYKYIVDRVANPRDKDFYRPPLEEISCPDYILKCMEDCWQEEPDARPDFRFINIRLKEMQAGLKPNIFDNMLAIMEKYARSLEAQVQERTNQLLQEKKRTEMLLLRMLPKSVADQLIGGELVEPETFDSVTIYFSDIVGFTEISAESNPLQVVNLLNDLYSCFDSIIEHYQVYKVETIGDAYMVVSGLPHRNGDKHAGQIASMALHLLSEIQTFEIRHRPGERLKLRIGIHTGPCVAGIVGHKMPRYCLFGDTVNTASRMESSGEALKIHVSEACKNLLDKLGGYIVKERGLTSIKGKGHMRTYWLIGKSRTSSDATQVGDDTSSLVLQEQQQPVSRTLSTGGRIAKVKPYTFSSSNALANDQPDALIPNFLSPTEVQPVHHVITRASSLIEYKGLQRQSYSSSSDHRLHQSYLLPNSARRAVLTSLSQSSDGEEYEISCEDQNDFNGFGQNVSHATEEPRVKDNKNIISVPRYRVKRLRKNQNNLTQSQYTFHEKLHSHKLIQTSLESTMTN